MTLGRYAPVHVQPRAPLTCAIRCLKRATAQAHPNRTALFADWSCVSFFIIRLLGYCPNLCKTSRKTVWTASKATILWLPHYYVLVALDRVHWTVFNRFVIRSSIQLNAFSWTCCSLNCVQYSHSTRVCLSIGAVRQTTWPLGAAKQCLLHI